MDNIKIYCFKNDRQGVAKINNGDYIDELDDFTICIEADTELKIESYILLLTDIPFAIKPLFYKNNKYFYELDFDSVSEYFKKEKFKVRDYSSKHNIRDFDNNFYFYKLFLNYPLGKCDLIVMFNDGIQEQELFLLSINIVSSKIIDVEFESLVNYIQTKNLSIWAKSSLLKNLANNFTKEDEILWTITLLEDFVERFENEFLYNFKIDKIVVVKQDHSIVDYSENVNVSEESLFWLTNNLDVLIPTNSWDTDKLQIHNRLFKPMEILSSEFIESTDITENQTIHGFLDELIVFCIRWEDEFNSKVKDVFPITLQDRIGYIFNKRNRDKIFNIRKKIDRICVFLNQVIPVTKREIEINVTNKIESKYHYNFFYEFLIQWLNIKDATFSSKHNLYIGIDRMDALFEKACYYKIGEVLEELGYEIKNSDVIPFSIPKISNFYKKNSNKSINLFYGILPDNLITVAKTKGGALNPDFVIELESGDFIIIDAKYKRIRNIVEYDYPKLVLKYLHGIGYKEGGFFLPIALFVFFPDKSQSLNFYQNFKFDLESDNVSLPIIGSLGLSFDEKNKILANLFKKTISLIK